MKDLSLLNIEITVVSLLFAYYSGYLLGRKRKIWKFDDKKSGIHHNYNLYCNYIGHSVS